MNKWIKAMRLRTLPLAFACIGMGSFLAASHGVFRLDIFILCLLTTLSLQILSNLANDYGDSIHGADNEHREGPTRSVQDGTISSLQMKYAVGLFVLISLFLGVTLLVIAEVKFETFLIFIGLGLLSILGAILYTNGKLPYGYIGFGDLAVFVFFGWIGVIGTYFLMAGTFSWDLILAGASCGLLTVAVLNVNNIRDIESDKIAGKFSIPVRLGREKAIVYHISLLVIGILCAIIYVFLNYSSPKQLLFLVVIPLLIVNARAVQTKSLSKELDPYLKQMTISTLVFVLTFGIGILM